jgi:transcription termination factor Rho
VAPAVNGAGRAASSPSSESQSDAADRQEREERAAAARDRDSDGDDDDEVDADAEGDDDGEEEGAKPKAKLVMTPVHPVRDDDLQEAKVTGEEAVQDAPEPAPSLELADGESKHLQVLKLTDLKRMKITELSKMPTTWASRALRASRSKSCWSPFSPTWRRSGTRCTPRA